MYMYGTAHTYINHERSMIRQNREHADASVGRAGFPREQAAVCCSPNAALLLQMCKYMCRSPCSELFSKIWRNLYVHTRLARYGIGLMCCAVSLSWHSWVSESSVDLGCVQESTDQLYMYVYVCICRTSLDPVEMSCLISHPMSAYDRICEMHHSTWTNGRGEEWVSSKMLVLSATVTGT